MDCPDKVVITFGTVPAALGDFRDYYEAVYYYISSRKIGTNYRYYINDRWDSVIEGGYYDT